MTKEQKIEKAKKEQKRFTQFKRERFEREIGFKRACSCGEFFVSNLEGADGRFCADCVKMIKAENPKSEFATDLPHFFIKSTY